MIWLVAALERRGADRKERAMQHRSTSQFLRRVLIADAVTSAVCGLTLTIGSGFLASLLHLPEALLTYSGLSLFPFAAFVGAVATRESMSRAGVWTVIALNALWVVDSLVLAVSGWGSPTGVGTAFVIAQALVVAAFAEAEFFGLRRAAMQAV